MTAARTFARTRGLSRDEWLDLRRLGLGGSDMAALVRGDVWRVWNAKIIGDTTTETDAMRWGRRLEDAVADEFAARHPRWRVTRRHAILQHPTLDWPLANLDREIHTPDGPEVLEIKTSARPWEDGVPDYYQAQVQHYLAITGYLRARVAVLVGGREYAEYTVPADSAVQDALLTLGAQFWTRIQRQTPPPLDHTDAARAWLLAAYPIPTAPAPRYLNVAEWTTVHQYHALGQQIKALEADRQGLATKIRAFLGSSPGGLWSEGRRVTWVRSTVRQIDLDALRRDHPDLVAAYTRERIRDGGLRVTAKEDDA